MMVSLRARALASALGSMLAVACGSDPVAPKPVATPAAVRAAYGLLPGSCWRYRYSLAGSTLYANITATGPDTNIVAGKTVYLLRYQLDAGGLPTEDYFDTETAPEVRLLRHIEGSSGSTRINKRYEMDPKPLFASFKVDAMKKAILMVGDRFTTDAKPTDLPAEQHVWSVLTSTTVPTAAPFGRRPAYRLNYTLGGTASARYDIAPDFGIANFTDLSGRAHQVCAARVCDSNGACTGAESCTNLVCP